VAERLVLDMRVLRQPEHDALLRHTLHEARPPPSFYLCLCVCI
jgi:hypothetical protein